MRKKITLFVLLSSIVLSGCVPQGSNPVSSSKYQDAMQCSDYVATQIIIYEGKGKLVAIDRAIAVCDKYVNDYINQVLRSVEARNGWSSLDPSVRPEVKKRVISAMKEKLLVGYERVQ